MGHETRYNSSPPSSSEACVTLPVGSGRFATSITPCSIESHLSPLFKSSRLSREEDIRPESTSLCAAYCVVSDRAAYTEERYGDEQNRTPHI